MNAPIQIPAGWVILKVEDKRIFKVPSFEDSKNQLRQTLTQQHVGNYVRRLRESAKIVQ